MKLRPLQLLIIPIIVLIAASCSKRRDVATIEIDDTNLTACRDGATCQYLFTEQADLSEVNKTFISGTYRLFWYNEQTTYTNSSLYVKAPMQGDHFLLTDNEIRNGKVVLVSTCPLCLEIPFKPAGGYVKGINTKPGSRSDETKWLLEAQIFLQTEGSSPLKDTLYFKQYFYPNFVID